MNIRQSANEQSQPKRRGECTGERLLRDRPQRYAQIVEMLAAGVSLNQIRRQAHTHYRTIRAVMAREAATIEQRKKRLAQIYAFNAEAYAEQTLDQMSTATHATQSATIAGIMVDKLQALSAGVPSLDLNITVKHQGNELADKLEALRLEIIKRAEATLLTSGEPNSDSGAGNGCLARKKSLKTS